MEWLLLWPIIGLAIHVHWMIRERLWKDGLDWMAAWCLLCLNAAVAGPFLAAVYLLDA